jgi:hypothetical protein
VFKAVLALAGGIVAPALGRRGLALAEDADIGHHREGKLGDEGLDGSGVHGGIIARGSAGRHAAVA